MRAASRDLSNDLRARLRGIGFDQVASAVSSPHMTQVVRNDAVGTRTMPQVFGLTGEGASSVVVTFADKSDEGVGCSIHKVNRVVGSVGQVILLRVGVDPTDVEP